MNSCLFYPFLVTFFVHFRASQGAGDIIWRQFWLLWLSLELLNTFQFVQFGFPSAEAYWFQIPVNFLI